MRLSFYYAVPQEIGVPQGGAQVLSPILFNIVLEVLLRYVNAHAAELGVVFSADAAAGCQCRSLSPKSLRLGRPFNVVLVVTRSESF